MLVSDIRPRLHRETLGRAYRDLMLSGGATLNTSGADIRDIGIVSGYMVGGAAREVRVPLAGFSRDTLHGLLQGMSAQDVEWVGFWIDGADVVVDVSTHVETYGEALHLAAIRDEDAVYDIARDECVRLDDHSALLAS